MLCAHELIEAIEPFREPALYCWFLVSWWLATTRDNFRTMLYAFVIGYSLGLLLGFLLQP